MRLIRTFAAILTILPVPALADQRAPHSIETVGSAEIQVRPDMATIDIGVEASAPSAQAALRADSARMARAVQAIRGQGIGDDAIQTSDFSIGAIHPKGRDGQDDESRTTGYTVTNKVTVTVRDLARTAQIIDAAVAAGANAANAITFDVKDRAKYEDQAQAAAVRDARHRAEVMAGAEHAVVGAMISMSSEPALATFSKNPPAMLIADEAAPILPGSIAITASAYVTFAVP